jgi:hypothetical protein
MGASYFIVDGNTFPITRYGPPGEIHSNMGGSSRNRPMGSEIYVEVATAMDQSLAMWNINGSLKGGRIEFRDYDYDGSLKTIKFVDGICSTYSDNNNPDNVMLPRLLSLYIIPAKMIYEGF